MINDGGAERMVRNRKVEWWQIAAIVVMFLFITVVLLFFFFISNGDIMIDALNKATVKDGYNILSDVKEAFPDVAVYEYEQTDKSVTIEFRYYEEVMENDTNLLELGYKVKNHMEKYLEAHPEDFIVAGKRMVKLRFPDVVYSNYSDETSFEFDTNMDYVSYLKSDADAGEFVESLDKISRARVLSFKTTGGNKLIFGEEVDFSALNKIEGLEQVNISVSNDLSKEKIEEIRTICANNNIEFNMEE